MHQLTVISVLAVPVCAPASAVLTVAQLLVQYDGLKWTAQMQMDGPLSRFHIK
jgi:hypothetical protein